VALMGIGEFARLSRVSAKALRRYDELGLLPPSRVDPGSGYRWYSAGQLDRARLVAALRQVGVPLAQIKIILDLEPAAAAEQIDAYWTGAEADHAARRELACYLVDRLNGKRSVMYEVSVREVPARRLLSLLRYVHQAEFPAVAKDFFGRFTSGSVPLLAGIGGAPFMVYHGEVSEDSDGPVEWCRPVPDDVAAELAARFPDLTLRTELEHEEAFVHLASDYTVMTYDRRGNSRSALRGAPARISMAEQSADAAAVLRACGFESAIIFGNSGGATIALDLAATHPQATRTVVAHEPPVPRVLPDAGDYLAIYDEIERALQTQGWQAAFTLFQVRIGHMPPDRPELMTALLDPAQVFPPGPVLDVMQRVSGNWEYMMRYEMRSYIDYGPDLDQIAASGVRVVLAAGAQSDEPSRRMCTVIAGQLDTEFAEFPGGHTAPMEIPQAFAARLRSLLVCP